METEVGLSFDVVNQTVKCMLEGDTMNTNRIVHSMILNPYATKAKGVWQFGTKVERPSLSPK